MFFIFGPLWFVVIVAILFYAFGRKSKAERNAEAFFAAQASRRLIAAHQDALKAIEAAKPPEVIYPKTRGMFAIVFGSLVLIAIIVSLI